MYADCRFTIYFRISQNQGGRIFAGAFHQSLQLSWNLSMEFKTVRTRIRNEYQCPWISRIKACYTQNENEGCDHGAGRLSFFFTQIPKAEAVFRWNLLLYYLCLCHVAFCMEYPYRRESFADRRDHTGIFGIRRNLPWNVKIESRL